MIGAAKILVASVALVAAWSLQVYMAVIGVLPDGIETIGAEVLLIAALLGLLRMVGKWTWRAAKKANHGIDLITNINDRYTEAEERHARNEAGIARLEAKLDEGSERFGRIEGRLDEKRKRMIALEEGQAKIAGSLGLLADEERQLIRRAVEDVAPERRRPPVGRRELDDEPGQAGEL